MSVFFFFLVAWNLDKFSKWSQHINSTSRISGLCKSIFFIYLWSLFPLLDVSPRLKFFKFKYFRGWNIPKMEVKPSHTIMNKGGICIWKGVKIFCFSVSFQLPKKRRKKVMRKTQSFHILKHKFQQLDWHCKSLYDRVLISAVFGH